MAAENEVRDISLFGNLINLKQDLFDAIHPIGETYTQYPQQDDPMTIYNKNGIQSVWEEQLQYNGAFFRSSNALSTVWKVDDEDGYYTINGDTVTPVKVVADNGGTITIGSATANPSRTIDGKTYKEYSVSGYSTAAAGYINKTNGLSIQGSQNLKHGHSVSVNDNNFNTGEMSGDTYAWFGMWDSRWSSWKFGGRISYDWNGSAGQLIDTTETTSITRFVINMSHSHNANHGHSVNQYDNGGDESRPNNYTYRIWKRII